MYSYLVSSAHRGATDVARKRKNAFASKEERTKKKQKNTKEGKKGTKKARQKANIEDPRASKNKDQYCKNNKRKEEQTKMRLDAARPSFLDV